MKKNDGDSKWWYIDPGNDYDIDESINWLLTDLKGLDGTILNFIFLIFNFNFNLNF